MTYDGSQTVPAAGTRVQLLTDYAPCFTLTIQAVNPAGGDNTGNIYLGGRTIADGRGLRLSPGTYFTFPPQETNAYNVADFWIDAETSDDGVQFVYTTR